MPTKAEDLQKHDGSKPPESQTANEAAVKENATKLTSGPHSHAETVHGSARMTRVRDGASEIAAYDKACEAIAANAKKLMDAGMGGADAGKTALEVFRIMFQDR